MVSHIYKISVWIIESLSWVLFFLSLLFCFRKAGPTYMRSFPLYTSVNCIPAIICYLWPNYTTVFIFFFGLFELGYFSYFFTTILRSKKTIRALWCINALVGILTIIELLKIPLRKVNGRFDLAESFVLILAALFYFRELFGAPRYVNLFQNAAFWMATGILIYFVLLVPTVLFSSYFYYYGDKITGQDIYSLNSYSQIVSYAFYVKAMTCKPTL